jgi:predicted metal-dependent HD superfamily phosphohydrolase
VAVILAQQDRGHVAFAGRRAGDDCGDDGRVDLLGEWRDALRDAGATTAPEQRDRAGRQLLSRWREPARRYHDEEHLREVLTHIHELAHLAEDPAAVRLAAWFHDAVYTARPGADERASADLAVGVLSALGVPQARVQSVARLVALTAGHDPAPGDADGEVLCDADLAILGADSGRYARYAAAVREEYREVPDAAFRAGRAAVLRRLGAAPSLYRTEPARRHWEQAARRNLGDELARLDGA